MKKSAMAEHRGLDSYREYGYVPAELERESVTKTLEYAFDDWAIAAMARELGDEETHERFRERATWWRNVFDPETSFMRGRTAEGEWRKPFDPLLANHRIHTDYTEGNAWQHLWFVPHDVAGLMEAMGGEEAFLRKLDSLFTMESTLHGDRVSPDISGMIGQYAHGNEPSHHIPYLYNYVGRPGRTADRVRQIMATLYDDTPFGLSGNEDCGQMTAWYVLSALGVYPVNPAQPAWVLGSPLFPEAVIDLGNGRSFIVRARGVSDENRYVQSATLNGEPYGRSYVWHSAVTRGGVLELEMGPEPSNWATARGARPPSMSGPEAGSSGARGTPLEPDTEPAIEPPPEPATETAPDPTARDQETEPTDAEMAEAVREEFLHAWSGYLEHARGFDALRPLSRSGTNWYDVSLFMTPLDAYDTMLLMGLDEEARRAKEMVLDGLSFDHDISVQVFEVTIRLLGGLLAAYQMDGDPGFLALARELADRLLPAFESATGMPWVRVNLRTGETAGRVSNPAEIGTLMLEFGTLSKLTGDPVYYETVKRGMEEVFRRRSTLGLVGETIDVETGEWQNPNSHLSGRIDSWYEYLYKAWLLFEDRDFLEMWEASIDPVNRYLAHELDGRLWYGHAHMETGERTATRFGALDAFWPGVLALSGDLERASRLMRSVHLMWTTFDVEPEQMDYATMEIVSPGYPLRPEALESAYVLHTLTGDGIYQDMGRDIFRRIVRWCRTEAGYAHLADVRTKEQADAMESFFLAETLKYAYLLFAPDGTLAFDEVVFNTEAHPLRRTW
jgi:mannosidase alpha-like ER degradation enhancer 2